LEQVTIEESVLARPSRAGDQPLVSIGIPTFNRPLGLRKLLNSVKDQTYRNLEIIISDNCSDDPAVQSTILLFAELDQRIIHFRQKENIGLEENFNFVYTNSNGRYFIWMGDDDYFDTNYIEACVSHLQKNPDTILCSGIAKYYLKGNHVFDENMAPLRQQGAISRLLKYYFNVNKNGKFYGVFRNRPFQRKPLDVHVGCDLTFMGKLAILGKVDYTPSTSYHRSLDGSSATKKKMIQRFELNKFQSLFFEVYLSYEVATHIFRELRVRKKFGALMRKLITTMVFFELNLSMFLAFFKKLFKKKDLGD
jgi:glycosyltransferase involved in cell wall biosynthesis